jgi:histidine phosphotransferase ChpT
VYHTGAAGEAAIRHLSARKRLFAPGDHFMSGPVVLESLDLAALLCSRVCHDLISPVGAIVNGLEVLEDENDETTKNFALELIKKSARQASARLQFCRLAFGAAGSAGAQIDLGDAEAVARGFLEDDKTKLTWNLARILLGKNRIKLLLNLLILAGQTIPRGGTLTVDPVGEGEQMGFRITAVGLNSRIPQAMQGLLAGEPAEQTVDAHAIQPFYAGMLARSCGLKIAVAPEGDGVVVTASPGAAAEGGART